jgi:ubiquinone/menaquinone biosynthesis C-methylase UbiE
MSKETSDHAAAKAAATYNAAADHYDHPANTFWERFGRRTIERLHLKPGARVLDVCCGSGASALPAAEIVGAEGLVLAFDLATDLLNLGQQKADQRGLKNIVFRAGDMLDLGLPESEFDAVVCVFGIFFVPDMEAGASTLWGLVKPSGQLAITTWGSRFFEPVNSVFWESVRNLRPDLYRGFNPWDRISEPQSLQSLLVDAGVTNPRAIEEFGNHPLSSPGDWWTMVLGTGYRGTIEQLSEKDCEQVRFENLDFIRRSGVTAVEANVIYATATKP